MSQTKKQGSKEDCQGCGYWQPFPARSGESKRVGKCRRPITYIVNGKSYADGIFPKTTADMSCGDWKPKDQEAAVHPMNIPKDPG